MSTPVAPSMFGPRAGLLSRANPVVKLLGALLITLVIVVSADPVTNAVALAGQLVLLAGVGLGPWRLLRLLWLWRARALARRLWRHRASRVLRRRLRGALRAARALCAGVS